MRQARLHSATAPGPAAGDGAAAASSFDSLPCLVMQIDRRLAILSINRAGVQRLGYEHADQLLGSPLTSVLPADDMRSAELLARLATPEATPAQDPLDVDLLRRDDSRLPLLCTLARAGAPDDASTLLLGIEAGSLRQSQAAAAMFQTVSDNYCGSIVITDARLAILYANPAVLHMTGYTAPEVLGRTPALFKSGKTADTVYRSLWEALDKAELWQGDFINRRKDGAEYVENKTIAAIRDARGEVRYYFTIGEDVSQRRQHQQTVETLLTIDALTGLPNRSAFLDVLPAALDGARRQAKALTLLHIDIDAFFAVNDALGASAADRLIAETAARIRSALRHADRLARLGNDKFAILLGPHEPHADDDISDVSERVLHAVRSVGEALSVPAQKRIELTASIGIAAYPGDGNDASELLSHAMHASEHVKSNGGNGACRFDASRANTLNAQRELQNELRSALAGDEFLLHFQPQVSLSSGAIVGLEALLRWQHPRRGMVLPGEFIPLAEQGRRIIDIDDWVLRQACRQMRAWIDAGLPPVKVAVNLCARHLLLPGLAAKIAGLLAEHGVPARCLEIEITEGAMMLDVAAAIRSTSQLKAIGVRLSLDDFGTGYSSLAYLSRFPIDLVKIDQSFVRDITSNPANAAIAQATIAMSHKLGKIVLAEGVETEEQMRYLQRNECDEMQGYLFAMPLAPQAVAGLLETGAALACAHPHDALARSTVLFVDDEATILAALRRALRREGYTVLTAQSAAEGYALLARNAVQVIVSDQRMPDIDGTEFLGAVKTLYPQTVRMVLSAHSDIGAVTDSINKGAVFRFMLKPWDDGVLKHEISEALRHWRELYGARRAGDETPPAAS